MSEAVADPESLPSKAPSVSTDRGLRARLAKDRLAQRIVVVSGFTVIFVILAIFLVIFAEVLPLFRSADVSLTETIQTGAEGEIFGMGTDEHKTVTYVVTEKGIFFQSMKGKAGLPRVELPDLSGAEITAGSPAQKNTVVLGLSDGRALAVRIDFEITFNDKNERSVAPSAEVLDFIDLDPAQRPVRLVRHHVGESGYVVAAVTGENKVTAVMLTRKKNLMGVVKTKKSTYEFQLPNKGDITSLTVGHELNAVYAGTASGQVIQMSLPNDAQEEAVEVIGATPDKAVGISLMGFLKGGMTLVLGDREGRVFSSQVRKGEDGRYHLNVAHEFEGHEGPVRSMGYAQRDKGFITAAEDGKIKYHYGTSGKTEYAIDSQLGGRVVDVLLTPKGDGIFALDEKGQLANWTVDNPHPGITLDTLFNEVLYEGYDDPEYSWQSTGGTDEFEPKFSLTPLIFGTLKGTLYAMLFAAPLALFAAFYSSQFMHSSLMQLVKPTVEFMAALPSVVLGFFAALWLAPRVEELLPSILMMPLVVAVLVFSVQYLTEHTGLRIFFKKKPAMEFYFLLLIVLVGTGMAIGLGMWFESVFLQGDFRVWLLDATGLAYDQRNSLVVGMAMGFAVVPIIFTIAEDSLSSVPKLLSAGSLALGATRWQTAVRVVLPTASPGIFSALMIGFGRAVGETMIVLMATGNTPVMDWSAFSGFRALSANIAVELPEAPEGGTLFRILFLAALLLFMFTFVVNTLAEWVRLKLRERYRVL